MSASSNVTEAFRANTRPSTTASVWTWMEVNARMFPAKLEFVPSVAELPTCHQTLHADAPYEVHIGTVERHERGRHLEDEDTVGVPRASRVSVWPTEISNVPESEL